MFFVYIIFLFKTDSHLFFIEKAQSFDVTENLYSNHKKININLNISKMPKKNYSLVFWSGSGEASVVKTEKIKSSSKAGFVVKVHNKNCPVRILLQDDNEEYLKTQTVDAAGNLMKKTAEADGEFKNPGKKSKGGGRGRKPKPKEVNPVDAEIVNERPIFELGDRNNLTDDLLKKNQSSSKAESSSTAEYLCHSDDKEHAVGRGTPGQSRRDKDGIAESSDAELSKKKLNKRKGTGADKNSEFDEQSREPKKLRKKRSTSSDDSDIDSSDKSFDKSENSSESKLFRKFLEWQKNLESKEPKVKKHRKDKKPKPKEVELIEESNIFVNRFKLDTITGRNKKNPREMTRQLFKLIIGMDELAKMTVTQKKGREKMPDKYLEAIYDYVTINTKNGMELSVSEFQTCVGKMLSGIRSSSKCDNVPKSTGDEKYKNDGKKNYKDKANANPRNDSESGTESDT